MLWGPDSPSGRTDLHIYIGQRAGLVGRDGQRTLLSLQDNCPNEAAPTSVGHDRHLRSMGFEELSGWLVMLTMRRVKLMALITGLIASLFLLLFSSPPVSS